MSTLVELALFRLNPPVDLAVFFENEIYPNILFSITEMPEESLLKQSYLQLRNRLTYRESMKANVEAIRDLAITTILDAEQQLRRTSKGLTRPFLQRRSCEEINQIWERKCSAALVAFFDLCKNQSIVCASLKFSQDLNPHRAATEIRQWLAEKGETLASIRLDASFVYQLPIIPIELLLYPLANHLEIISDALIRAAGLGDLRFISALIGNSVFLEIGAEDLGYALQFALEGGHSKVVKAILKSSRFGEIEAEDLGKGFRSACKNGYCDVVNDLIGSSRFHGIRTQYLTWSLMDACERGDLEIVTLLMNSSRFHEIPADAVTRYLKIARDHGHPEVVAILDCKLMETAAIPS